MTVLAPAFFGCGDASPPAPRVSKPEATPKRQPQPVAAAEATIPQPPEKTVVAVAAAEKSASEAVYRPDDQRPRFDDARLGALGIHRYESKRLRLYTDIDAEQARPLPAVIDAAYDALVAYFRPLPPSRAGEEFQMTGYLIGDERRFREAGLIPENLPPIEHGRHRRNEFWLREQPYDYYRRHLLIHEATHCVMTYMPENRAPVWYLEGMAEMVGTHRKRADGAWEFAVMPTSPEEFAGFGRITLLRQKVTDGQGRTLPRVFAYTPEEFLDPEPYAWSWAACWFLDQHPRYSTRFRELGRNQQPRAFASALETLLSEGGRELATEWALFLANLEYGYDVPRAAITFVTGTPFTNDEPRAVEVAADRGWQSTKMLLHADQRYAIATNGRFTVARQPKPWVSEGDGISFRYVRGQPLGKLLACIREETGPAGVNDESMLQVLPIGSRGEITSPVTGTLYLRLNDSWSELADNTGSVTVSVTPVGQ